MTCQPLVCTVIVVGISQIGLVQVPESPTSADNTVTW
jgi:hypothetical protein